MRDLLTLPFDRTDIHNALSRVLRFVKEEATASGQGQQLVSFLPAKVGSGASTVALQTAFTISRFGGGRTALIDFDFDFGVIDFMLKLPFGHGLADLIEYGPLMDETVWSRTVSKFGDLDVVRAGKTAPGRRFTAVQARHAFDFAIRNYNVVCADLPGPLDDLAIAVLAQSSQILLVCTPEISSVYLARKRLETLTDLGLQDKVRIILNRYNPKGILRKEGVEDVLKMEVASTIPNEYGALQNALTNGRPLDLTTPLGRCFTEISNRILGVRKNSAPDSAESSLWTTIRELLFPAKKSKLTTKLALPAPLQIDSAPECDKTALVPLSSYKA
jgi:Flp pilus assembly CpaE family ATPase